MAKNKNANKNGLTIGSSVSIDADNVANSTFYSQVNWTLEEGKVPTYEQAEFLLGNALYLAMKTASNNFVQSMGDGDAENGQFILQVMSNILDAASGDEFKRALEKQ